MKHYAIYYNSTKLGETWAESPAKAINNYRYRTYGTDIRYKNYMFKAREI